MVFGRALAELSVDDVRAIAFDLQAARASTADEVAGTRAMLFIEQTLRRTHRLHDAASAALDVATNVQQVAERGQLALPDDDVTRVARAAAQIARGMIVGDYPGIDDALQALGKGWHRLACLAEFQAA
ncbi:MAG TPA: hypothetical protein VIK54_07525 [Acidimicrobiia bacterium]